MRTVRQVRERGRQPDLQPALARMPADRFVPQRLCSLAVGGQEQPRRLPLLPPLRPGRPRGWEVMPGPREPPPAAAHAHLPRCKLPPCHFEAVAEALKSLLLAMALGLSCVPFGMSPLLSLGDGETVLDTFHPGLQAGPSRAEVPLGQLPLILGRAGDSPGPSRRRPGGEGAFAFPARHRAVLPAKAAFRAAYRQVSRCERPQMPAGRTQDRLILRSDAQPGPHPRTRRRRNRERAADNPQTAHPRIPDRRTHELIVSLELTNDRYHSLSTGQFPTLSDAGRLPATIAAPKGPIGRHQATSRDSSNVPSRQRVTGVEACLAHCCWHSRVRLPFSARRPRWPSEAG